MWDFTESKIAEDTTLVTRFCIFDMYFDGIDVRLKISRGENGDKDRVEDWIGNYSEVIKFI